MTRTKRPAKTLHRMGAHRKEPSMNTSSTEKLQQLEIEYRKRIEAIDRDLSQPAEADFAEQVTQKENTDVLRSLKSLLKKSPVDQILTIRPGQTSITLGN
jgi:hypothetical protein